MISPLDLPIPYKGEQPNDYLAHAMSILRLTTLTMEERPELHDRMVALDDVMDRLKPILMLLNHAEVLDVACEHFAACRREVIAGRSA